MRTAVCGILAGLAGPATANTFTITPDTTSPLFSNWNWHILVNGADSGANPTLFVKTGSTYTFDVTTSSIHPFWIDQFEGLGGSLAASPYAGPGISTNGLESDGTITLDLPANAPDTLYYACGNHSPMTGAITVIHDLVFRDRFDN